MSLMRLPSLSETVHIFVQELSVNFELRLGILKLFKNFNSQLSLIFIILRQLIK